MKVTVEIDVTGCSDCPLTAYEHSHGFSGHSCEHPKSPEGYGSILPSDRSTPDWCPLGLCNGEIT